jgi:hypothetical protein
MSESHDTPEDIVDHCIKIIRNLRNVGFVEILEGSTDTWTYEKNCRITFVSKDNNTSEIIVCFTIPYTSGIADYLDIRSRIPQVNYIIVVSSYASFTQDVLDLSRRDGVILMNANEFIKHIYGINTQFTD